MEKEIVNEVQEAQRVPYRINPRKNTSRHILIKITKTKHKERILKAAREKQQVTHKGNSIHLTADLSAETLQARREWQDIFKVPKGGNLQPRLLYLAMISFKIDGEIKKLFRQAKVKRIQYHQTSFTTNVKGNYKVKEIQEKKKDLQNQPQTIKKMAIGTYISIITLNGNGLNVPTKRHRLAEWIQKQDPYI